MSSNTKFYETRHCETKRLLIQQSTHNIQFPISQTSLPKICLFCQFVKFVVIKSRT